MKKNSIQKRAAFSLVEMLAVIAILAVLAGFGFGTYFLVNKNARITQAQVMIDNLSSSLENRVSQTGAQYPENEDDLYALLSGDLDSDGKVDEDETPAFKEMDPQYDGKGKYLNNSRQIIDPWATPIRYEFPGTHNNVEDGYDLSSAGPDQEFGTDDDIKNW